MTRLARLVTLFRVTAPAAARPFRVLLLATSLAVSVSAQERADEQWLEELTLQLTSHLALEGELVLEWARARPVEAGEPAELTLLNKPSTLTPQMLLRVRATDATGSAAEHTLVVRVQLWREGWAAKEPTNRGEVLAITALETQRYDAMRERDAVAASDALDLIYVRSVPAGRLLTWRDVARRPLVRRGQLIEVAATDGSLTVTLRGVALADAGRGEVVRVRNPDSRREFTAQVVGDARAQVNF